MLDLAIRGAEVVGQAGLEHVDIGIEDGAIAVLAADVGPARREIDASGMLALPATIDTHVHFNEPGRTEWEGFATGSAALAAGGGSAFFDMPLNSEPPLLDRAAFDRKLTAARASSIADFGLWGGLTPDNLGTLEELAAAGVVGFKAFMSDSGITSFRAVDDHALWRGMQVASDWGIPVAVHAENDDITRELSAQQRRSGHTDARAWTAARPPIAEIEAVARALFLAEATGASVHIVHVSTGRSAELVAAARERGVDATCETCPHYLHFTTADAARIGFDLKCAPPVRDAETRADLWAAVRSKQIDLIASDHSPSPPDLKQGSDWFAAWGGVAGVQSTLSALLEHVELGDLELAEIPRLLATAPARRYGLTDTKGKLAAGFDADVVLVRRRDAPRTLQSGDLKQRHATSPWVGERFRWDVMHTLRRGETIFADGTITAQSTGRLLTPHTRTQDRARADRAGEPDSERNTP